jgi:hypothetical protein
MMPGAGLATTTHAARPAYRLQHPKQEVSMSLTMILVIVLVIALLTGGGYYWRRW